MDQEQIEKVKVSIQKLEDKTSRIYFFVHDTKGNPKASIKYIYDMALTLKRNGYNAIILHEKKDYTGVSEWLNEEYMSQIPHQVIEGENIEISPEDFLVVPEIFAYMMDQVKNLPCGKIVLTQAYAHMLETLQPGQSWSQFGFFKCITTSDVQKKQIEKVMRNNSYDICEPFISDSFKKQEKPPMPIIGVHSREQSDTINLIKTFYLRFPQYRWFTFRDLRGLSQDQFAQAVSECMLTVWIDHESGYGTFPLESMKCGVPVIGIAPELVPHWMNEDNGVWIKDRILLPELVGDWIQNWLEDNIAPSIYENMEKTVAQLPAKEDFENKVVELFSEYLNHRAESMKNQISKLPL
jgi:hypothetical protein